MSSGQNLDALGRIEIGNVKKTFTALFSKPVAENGFNQPAAKLAPPVSTSNGIELHNGDVLIMAGSGK